MYDLGVKPRSFPGRDRDESKVRATVSLTYEIALTGKVDDLGAIHNDFSKAIEALYDTCDARGVSIIQASGQMRGLSQVEILALVPRRYHMMGPDKRQICDTSHVSTRFLTDKEAKVTCRLCAKKLKDRPTSFERISRDDD